MTTVMYVGTFKNEKKILYCILENSTIFQLTEHHIRKSKEVKQVFQ